jgi:enoyl-CoA hydratase/carnithine racemase
MKDEGSQGDNGHIGTVTLAPNLSVRGAAGVMVVPAKGHIALSACKAMLDTLLRWRADPHIYCVIIKCGDDLTDEHHLSDAPTMETDTYRLVWEVDRFPKPIIVLLDQPVSGAAAALALVATHTIMGDAASIAFDDTSNQRTPGLGVTAALGQLPDNLGRYYCLSGRPIHRAAAWRLGLASHCLPSGDFQACEAELAAADCVDPVFDQRHIEPGQQSDPVTVQTINRAFSKPMVPDIIAALQSETGAQRDCAQQLANELATVDPVLAELTMAMVKRPAVPSLKAVLQADQRLAHQFGVKRGTATASVDLAEWSIRPVPGEAELPERDFIPSVPT